MSTIRISTYALPRAAIVVVKIGQCPEALQEDLFGLFTPGHPIELRENHRKRLFLCSRTGSEALSGTS